MTFDFSAQSTGACWDPGSLWHDAAAWTAALPYVLSDPAFELRALRELRIGGRWLDVIAVHSARPCPARNATIRDERD